MAPNRDEPPHRNDHRLHLRTYLMRAAVRLRAAVGQSTQTASGVADQATVNSATINPIADGDPVILAPSNTSLTARYRYSTTDSSPSILRSSSAPENPSEDQNQTVRRGTSRTQEPEPVSRRNRSRARKRDTPAGAKMRQTHRTFTHLPESVFQNLDAG